MRSSFSRVEHHSMWLNAFVMVIGLGMAAVLGSSLVRSTMAVQSASDGQGNSLQSEVSSKNTSDNIVDGVVLGESDIALPGALKSEHYTLGQVALGGDTAIASSDNQEATGPLEISGVRGEAFMDKGKKDVNILITWKTTKLSSASIQYGKNGSDALKTFEEDGYGLNHSVILTGLDQSSTYVYAISAKDRSGNDVSSDSYAVYTGTKTASLFDLISGAVTDTFGWAMKR